MENQSEKELISVLSIRNNSYDSNSQYKRYSNGDSSINHEKEFRNSQPKLDEEQSIEKKRMKSFSPLKNLRFAQQAISKPSQEQFQRPPVLITSYALEEPQSTIKPLLNPRNSITYLLQNQTSHNPSGFKRSDEEIELIRKLIEGNRLWKDLGYQEYGSSNARCSDIANFQQMTKQICNSIVLLWSQIPNITETKPNEVYLILQGKTFEYIHNESATIKLKIHENNDYLMIRKLNENDYFMTLSPQIRPKAKIGQHLSEKYQLMVDQKTLLGKVSDELFVKWIQRRLMQRTRNLTSFMKKIILFENLPDIVFHELSKFIGLRKVDPNTEIIKANQKSKDIYFVKKGEVEFNLLSICNNEKEEDLKKIKSQILRDFDVFGMDTLHTVKAAGSMVQYLAKSLTQCQLYFIDKRILAIVISSFQKEFKLKSQVIKSIDINSQIKGQNYLSQKQEILTQNAQRIKTSQKRIRDVKLQSFSRKKNRQVNTYIPEKDRVSQRKAECKSNDSKFRSSGGFNLLRNKSLKSQGSLLNIRESTDSQFWTLKNKYQMKYENKQIQNENMEKSNYNNYVIPVMDEGDLNFKNIKTHTLISNSSYNEFQKINKKSLQVFSTSREGKIYGATSPKKSADDFNSTAMSSFIPRVKSKSSIVESSTNSGKIESEIIKNHIQKKIKNQLVRKAQEVLERKSSTKRNPIKNIKKFYNVESFSPKKVQSLPTAQEMSRKELTDELVDKMANVKNYPLLNLIESQRKKMQSLSKVKSIEYRQVQQKRQELKKDKKFKGSSNFNSNNMAIFNSQFAPSNSSQALDTINRFSSSGSRILSEMI